MPGPILFCDSWNLKEAETRPDLGFFYNTYIPIFSTILEVEILPILVLRGAFNRRKNSSLDFLGGRKGGLGWFLIILLVELRAKENTTFSSVWWEDKDFTGWHRLHYGPQWPTRTCWVPPQLSPLSGEIFAHGPLHLQLSVPCWGPVKETATSKSTYDCYNVHLRQQFSTQDVYFKRAKYLQNIVLSKSFRQTHQAHFVALSE